VGTNLTKIPEQIMRYAGPTDRGQGWPWCLCGAHQGVNRGWSRSTRATVGGSLETWTPPPDL